MSTQAAPASEAPTVKWPRLRRLNWGCGATGETGWINSDIKAGPGIHLPCDILAGLPLETDSIEYCVSIHALPEIPLDRVVDALRELRRVLVPGGVLRLGLPDLERAIAAYQLGERDYFLIPDSDARSLGGKLITQLLWYGYSRSMYTWDSTRELLLRAGFRDVTRCGYRQTDSAHAGIVELDNRERESLFVEAAK